MSGRTTGTLISGLEATGPASFSTVCGRRSGLLATALYVRIDDELKARPELRLWRPKVGIAPKLSDAELMTMAVVQVLLGFAKEAQWIRYASKP